MTQMHTHKHTFRCTCELTHTHTCTLSTGISHHVPGALKHAVSFAVWVTWGCTCPVLLTTVTGLCVWSVAGGDAFCLWVFVCMRLSVCVCVHVHVCVYVNDRQIETEKDALSFMLLRISLCLFLALRSSLLHTYCEAAAVTETLRTKTCNQELQYRCYDCCFSERLCFMLIVLTE